MCGIAGILTSIDDNFSDDLKLMNNILVHRGPDSEGIWTDRDAGIGLAHRRLAIVDISSAGHQPMTSPSGRYVISYNGEIYNHLEIRADLQKNKNIRWRGHSDTETLIVAIDNWGLQATVKRLVGMFALALWDRKERVLQLCRDRIGEKPLYYGYIRKQSNLQSIRRFVFTSELKALSIPGAERKVSKDALVLYFRYHYIPSPYSIYEGIFKLDPGCIATIPPGGKTPTITPYWSAIDTFYRAQSNPFKGDIREATGEVERQLYQSVKSQMMADVPVGAFLSGGIDSSATVAMMQQIQSSEVKTFSIGFEDSTHNEAPFAKQVARSLGSNHCELYLDNDDVVELITNMPCMLDEPFADSSLLPTFAVSKLARETVTVSLSGDAGDELFGGYTRYPITAKAIIARKRFGIVGQLLADLTFRSRLLKLDYTGRATLPFNLDNFPSLRKLGTGLHTLKQTIDPFVYRNQVSFWRNPDTPVLNPGNPKCKFQDSKHWLSTDVAQEAIQMMDVQTFLPDDILCKVDRAAMSVSLETRIPMLDHRFISLVWSLPAEYRTFGVEPKKILKDIVCKSIPRDQIERPKMGFGVPIGKWIHGPLSEWTETMLSSHTIAKDGLLDPGIVRACWNNTKNDPSKDAGFLWSILVLQQWLATERPST